MFSPRALAAERAGAAGLSLGGHERWAVDRLAAIAAVLVEELPSHSLVLRLLEPVLHELDCWASDPRLARGRRFESG